MTDDAEQQAKLDFTFDVSETLPFLTNLQAGYQRRDREGNGWAGGGYTVRPGTGNVGAAGYVAPVVVPTENLTVNYRSCMPTATSTQPCQYGYVGRDHGRHQQQPRRQSEQHAVRHDDVHARRPRRPDLELPCIRRTIRSWGIIRTRAMS